MYRMYTWGDAFTPRQLVALTTFSELVGLKRARRSALMPWPLGYQTTPRLSQWWFRCYSVCRGSGGVSWDGGKQTCRCTVISL